MICMAAHRYALKHAPNPEPRIYRNDNTQRGRGFHEHLTNKACRDRYRGRRNGTVAPLEYVTLDQALKALIW